jgi:hypothetical protein
VLAQRTYAQFGSVLQLYDVMSQGTKNNIGNTIYIRSQGLSSRVYAGTELLDHGEDVYAEGLYSPVGLIHRLSNYLSTYPLVEFDG